MNNNKKIIIADAARLLLEKLKQEWKQCRDGYRALASAQYKAFSFGHFTIKLQFNPERIKSTSAKVDKASITERKCFLCTENRPPEQHAIEFENYLILCNPYPIFPEHFTVVHKEHIPQAIKNSFSSMLSISRELSKYYTVFYNGPKCGASAPDHLHFQACTKMFMPIEKELSSLSGNYGNIIVENTSVKIYSIDDDIRRFFVLESGDANVTSSSFLSLYEILARGSNDDEEPMMNIICNYIDNKWRVIVFPREKHRPSHYFRTDDEKILLSPASVDAGGLCILPLKNDFIKISKQDITDIFNEVMYGKDKFINTENLLKNL